MGSSSRVPHTRNRVQRVKYTSGVLSQTPRAARLVVTNRPTQGGFGQSLCVCVVGGGFGLARDDQE